VVTVLFFKSDDDDNDGVCFARAAQVVRCDTLD